MQTCPKCGYLRSAADTAPDWECPACGIAYAKFGTLPHGHPRNLEPSVSDAQAEELIISQFQNAQLEMKPLWYRNVGVLGVPGFVLFAVGDGYFHSVPVFVLGLLLFMTAIVRGALLIWRYRQCPACKAIQGFRIQYPCRICVSCGVRLSHGTKDSI